MHIDWNAIILAVIAFFGATGLWTYIDHEKERRIKREDKHDEIMQSIQSVRAEVEEIRKEARVNDEKLNRRLDIQKADDARNRILRFADECAHHVDHSEEFFNQILEDITMYRDLTSQLDGVYINSKAESSIRLIESCYETAKRDSSFI